MMHRAWLAAAAAVGLTAARGAADTLPFTVRADRPRMFVRATEWQGPNVPRMREWFKAEEYQKRGIDAVDSGAKRWAVFHWLVHRDTEAGRTAVAALGKRTIGGDSPSYSGKSAQMMAASYDWLRDHPDFTPEKRAIAVAELEKWGDYFSNYIRNGTAFFYARFPGAISGLGCIGLALYGDSPKADGYIALAYKSLLEYGRARAWEGGATAGGNYSIYHAFPDLARLVCAFESATDAHVLAHIRDKQNNWLERQLEWQIWATYPTGYFVKEGDLWRDRDNAQMRANVDVLTGLLNNGFGRTHADAIYQRWGTGDYVGGYVWDFFTFNNSDVKARPLDGLRRATMFGQESHGYVFFRSGWGPTDTHIFFKCGEGLDVHAMKGSGHFIIWRGRSLALRSGPSYTVSTEGGSAWDCNTMIFTSGADGGTQPNTKMKNDVPLDFDAFLKRKQAGKVESGNILEFDAKDAYARVKGDLTATSPKTLEKWTRELVWLGYKYLIVLDRVRTQDKPVEQRWLLHLDGERKVAGPLAQTTLDGQTLFCRTLLPADARFADVTDKSPWRREVMPKDDRQRDCSFLHVLAAMDAKDAAMPDTNVRQDGAKLTVTVGGLSHTFAE